MAEREQIAPSDVNQSTHCVEYVILWQYGIELGIYTLTLDHPDGQVTHSWGMDYPFCQTAANINNVQWLMGYAPNEQLTLAFFASMNSATPAFVAVRNVRADGEGALNFDIQVARSAPFTTDQLSFAVIGPQRELYYPPHGIIDTSSFDALGFVRPEQPIPPARYSTYNPVSSVLGIFSEPCEGEYGRFVEIAPFNGSSGIPLYADVNNGSVVGQIAAGMPAEVLEYRPVITNGRVAVWKHLRAEDGSEGWNASLDFVKIFNTLLPGSRVESAQVGVQSAGSDLYYPTNPSLYSAPAATPTSELSLGTPMTAFGYRTVNNSRWWFVRTDDGRAGWLPRI